MKETRPLYPLRKNKRQVLKDLSVGMTAAEIARKYEVTIQAVQLYAKRHQPELQTLKQAVLDSVRDYVISEKRYRVGQLQELYDESGDWQRQNGLTVTTQRFDKDGNVIGESRQFNSDLVRTRASLLRQAAEELDHLPRSGNQINIDARTQTIRLSWSDGEQA